MSAKSPLDPIPLDHVPSEKLNWERLAEERIQNAQAAGEFENLPGFGRPIPGIDEPHDELWWVKQTLEREKLSILPPALELRKDVERTRERIAKAPTEHQVRQEVTLLNARIRRISLGACYGPSVDVMPLDVEEVLADWRASR